MVGSPSYLILLSHIAGPRDSLCDICYTTHHLSLCILLISREYLFCHFLPAANLFILSKHVFASPTLSYFFFILSLSFIFDPFSSLGHWSFCLSPCSLLSSVLPNSSTSLLSLAWPFLSVFFCLSLRFIKEYPKLVVSVCVWPLCPSFSLCLCLFLPYRSSSLSVCQVLLNPCQSGGIHR